MLMASKNRFGEILESFEPRAASVTRASEKFAVYDVITETEGLNMAIVAARDDEAESMVIADAITLVTLDTAKTGSLVY